MLAFPVAAVGVSLDAIALFHFLRSRTTRQSVKARLGFGARHRRDLPADTQPDVPRPRDASARLGAIYLGNLAALAGVPLFILYMNRFQIAPEERALEARFGAEYIAYRTRVRRWL